MVLGSTSTIQFLGGDVADTLFSVGTSGSMAGRIAASGFLDRETTDFYTISIRVKLVHILDAGCDSFVQLLGISCGIS